jgi:two-component system, cell cycle sensor histidine kinase and response regulator CckA
VVAPGRYVMLAVTDNGCGMNEEVRAHIFEPFFTTKEKGKGTGLGLATVYGIVKQSGGYIWVYSEPGVGTTFKIYLPRIDEEESSSSAGVDGTLSRALRGSEVVLLVEDERGVRELTREYLEMSGYTVLEATNGEAALRQAQDHTGPIHALITDVVMPGLSGRELSEQITKIRPQIKVLYMSGYTDQSAFRNGILEKGAELLQKPFGMSTLASKLRDILAN